MTKDRVRKHEVREQAAATGRSYQAVVRASRTGAVVGVETPLFDDWDGVAGGWPSRDGDVERLAAVHDLTTADGVSSALAALAAELDHADGWDYTEWSMCARRPAADVIFDTFGRSFLDGPQGGVVRAAMDRYERVFEVLRSDMEFAGARD